VEGITQGARGQVVGGVNEPRCELYERRGRASMYGVRGRWTSMVGWMVGGNWSEGGGRGRMA
jgi:hypothetical protein